MPKKKPQPSLAELTEALLAAGFSQAEVDAGEAEVSRAADLYAAGKPVPPRSQPVASVAKLVANGEVLLPPDQRLATDNLATPEVIPTDPRNPAFRERVIVAIVKSAGDVDAALRSIGCSWEVYKQVTDHSDWDKEVERVHHRMVVQPLLAAGKAAVMQKVVEEGNAYSLKMLYDTAPKDKLNEEDAAYLDSMSGAPRNILLREANKLAKEAANLIESLEGGRRPSKQMTDQIVREVSERPKRPKKITA